MSRQRHTQTTSRSARWCLHLTSSVTNPSFEKREFRNFSGWPFPSSPKLARPSSPSRVRCAAPTTRALDCSGRPAKPHLLRGKEAMGAVAPPEIVGRQLSKLGPTNLPEGADPILLSTKIPEERFSLGA